MSSLGILNLRLYIITLEHVFPLDHEIDLLVLQLKVRYVMWQHLFHINICVWWPITLLIFFKQAGHQLQKYCPRIQRFPWSSLLGSICPEHEVQDCVWPFTDAFRNNRHKGTYQKVIKCTWEKTWDLIMQTWDWSYWSSFDGMKIERVIQCLCFSSCVFCDVL